jgi:hypothetical protein
VKDDDSAAVAFTCFEFPVHIKVERNVRQDVASERLADKALSARACAILRCLSTNCVQYARK